MNAGEHDNPPSPDADAHRVATEDLSVPPSLTFPDLPRLELDQLLAQLVERAQEVMAAQGRLRGLLRATQMVTRDLALPVVLRRIVEAARELVGARYAALGVISPTGGLAEFVHSGMPAEAVERIGHLPEGKGLLGALIDDPRPIRLRRIADDARSTGFPPGHPPMDSFLGVPIRVRDEVFGNLYLTESTRGEFSAEDEELTKALAATAAVAVENARLYESAQTRGEWLQATAAITRQVMAADPGAANRPLHLIAEASVRTARADLVTVVLPAGDGELRVEVAVGTGAEHLSGTILPVAGSLSGQVFTTGMPVRQSVADRETAVIAAAAMLDVGPVLVVPLLGSTQVHGVLWAGRRRGQPAFAPRSSTWPPASPTRPLSRSNWPRPAPSSSGPRCSTSATGSPPTCTTTSSSGCSPPGCPCRAPRRRWARARRPTGSSPRSTTWTTRSARSAPASSSSSRSDRPQSAACARGCSTWPPS